MEFEAISATRMIALMMAGGLDSHQSVATLNDVFLLKLELTVIFVNKICIDVCWQSTNHVEPPLAHIHAARSMKHLGSWMFGNQR